MPSQYQATFIDYIVTFLNWDNSEIKKVTYHYGDTIVSIPNPERESDETYTYEFIGWNKPLGTCTGNTKFTAQYEETYINYSIVFKDENGNVLSRKTNYHYGDTIVKPANPVKEADNTYTYTFKGWKDFTNTCVGNAEYTPEFTRTYIEYLIVFNNYDGSEISTATYHYGDAVVEPTTPTKAADNTYTYSFKSWDKVIVNCEGDAIYTATYERAYINYTVTFKNYDGEVLSEETYHYGDNVVEPVAPTKPANETYTYAFSGWDSQVVACDGNKTYIAQFTATNIDYTVTFLNYDGTEISKATYHYGDIIIQPANPTKPADNTYTYTFAGWGKEVVNCNGNATYTATYSQNYIDYTIKFVDEDGSEISTATYHYGDAVVEPATPTKAADNTYTYSFKSWDKVIVNCEGDAIYTATYESAYINYTVTFKNYDGEVLSEETYHYGDNVVEPVAPTKPANEINTYAFSGWDSQVVACDGNKTYIAQFAATNIDYTVTFLNYDGTEISKETYHYGDAIIQPANPTKQADNTYTYTFAGWDKEVVNCNGDTVYTATYNQTYIEYTIIFKNYNGAELSNNMYHYGDTVVVPSNPSKAADNTYTYTFAGWDKEVVNCEGSAIYTATYESAYINYTVTFKNYDGEVLSEKTYHYGDNVVEPVAPTKPADETNTYAFSGWDNEVVDCNGNATYIATYTATPIEKSGGGCSSAISGGNIALISIIAFTSILIILLRRKKKNSL